MPTNDKSLHYLTINDFSPGIVADYRTAGYGYPPLVADSKPGAAAATYTINGVPFFTRGCYATPEGQLAPLPVGAQYLAGIQPSSTTDTFVDTAGLAVLPNGLGDDLFTWMHVTNSTPRDAMNLYKNLGRAKQHVGPAAVAGPARGVTYTLSRGRRASFATPGGPELFYEWTSGEPHTDGSVYFYEVWPDPNAPTVDGTFEETGTIANATFVLGGQVLSHSGRILRLCEQAHDFGNRKYYSNERVRNTDPPNSVSLTATTTDSILDPQYPGTFGAWGSLSFGELLLIKQYGGAVLVEGDIYAPQITRLPAVHSTGLHMSQMAWSIQGLVYMTDDGPYVWTGGSSSQRIGFPSRGFHFPACYAQNAGGSGITCSVINWNNLIVFSGGMVWDSASGAWWVLNQPQTAGNLVYFAASTAGTPSRDFYAVTDTLDGGSRLQLYRYTTVASSGGQYTWLSQPLPTSYDTVDIVSVEISVGSINPGSGGLLNAQVQFLNIDGNLSQPVVWSQLNAPLSGQYLRLRQPCGVRASSIVPFVTVGGTSFLPTINSITIGYKEAGRFGATV